MADRLRVLPYGLLLLGFLAITGCPPPAAHQPSLPSSSAKPSSERPDSGIGTAAREAPTGPSSLDQMRLGNPTSTPGSSPLREIYFDFNSSGIRADARDTLRGNADWLKTNPSARVEIEGHADDRGTNEYNLALGAKRAQTAKDYLVTLGISTERLSTISYGEELAVCKEATEQCWQRNRRARFVIVAKRPAS